MRDASEIKRQRDLSRAYVAGERVLGVRFRHNSHVRFSSEDGTPVEGWIVAVGPIEPEPIYTVERSDGGGDEEVLESKIEVLFEPHEPPKT
jgi:hypothetical protein